jgi:cell division protein FtsB
MDYKLKEGGVGGKHREESRSGNTVRETFAEQLQSFLRRNMTWFLVIGFALLLAQDIFGTHGVLAMRRSQLEAQSIEKEISHLDAENKKLQGNVKNLKTDPGTLERTAREEFGLARIGELIFKTQQYLPDSAKPAPQPNDTSKDNPKAP